jgi:hypothetical protein
MVRFPIQASNYFSTPQRPDRLWDPPNLLHNVYRGLFPLGVKRTRREADHSPAFSAEVKNSGIIPPFPHTFSWRVAYLIKQRNNFTSRASVVGIAPGYGLDDRGVGVRVPVGARIFSSPRLPDRFWGPPNLL